MHYKEVKGILSATNGMNLYRGCTHGCIYCDARSKCYSMDHEFTDIEIKSNALELLEIALKKKRNKCMIGTGAMSDPYIHYEETVLHTRKSLELIEKYGFGVSIQTKSNRILRDLDLLIKINEKAKCVVNITLTTYDEELCKVLEPNVSTTKERYEVLKVLQAHNIPTVVWLDPILPFINDTEENMKGILDYCIDAGVVGIIYFGAGLSLREGNREYFYEKLDIHFPGIKEKYQKRYGNQYIILSPDDRYLSSLFYATCKKHGIMSNADKVFAYLKEFPEKKTTEQMSLF